MHFKDIHNNTIKESDKVLVYVQKYARTFVGENIYEVDQNKPCPVADVPMARGQVEWSEDVNGFVVRYDWACKSWEHKSASQMDGGNYAYEILNNEN
jgi:hypothetical protein